MCISTPSCSANLRAAAEGRTWNPMIMASEAAAKVTSDSDICPTALWITLTCICSVDNLDACKTREECYALSSYKNELGECPHMDWDGVSVCRIHNDHGLEWYVGYCR